MSDQEVIVAFQIWDRHPHEDSNREFLGVFTYIDELQKAVNALDPDKSEGSSICYYIAELDAPGSEAQWELHAAFLAPSEEVLAERATKDRDERTARIARNRRDLSFP